MSGLSRRRFLAASAVTAGAAAAGTGISTASAQPAARRRKPCRHGDLRDIKHVVILMQENRSFDHYFGSMRGVRGFGDRSTITLPGGHSVFQQPITPPGVPATLTQYPWHLSQAPASKYPGWGRPPTSEVGAQGFSGTPHGWDDQHGAWAGGLMNGWVEAKLGTATLGYLNRSDLPFHYALADAYTVGDAYHSSVLSATGPNRTYHWSGTIDAQQKYRAFTAYDGGDELGTYLQWESYAEALHKAGVSWKVYQCLDNYGDNALQYFKSFAVHDPAQGGKAKPGNALYDHGVAAVPEPLTGVSANADNIVAAIAKDVRAGTLPQVSWVVPNQEFSEHPDGAPNNGAYLMHRLLETLHSDPDLFNSTLVVLNYDENDGLFDHVPPPIAPPGTTDEWYSEKLGAGILPVFGPTGPVPVGLGFRVPLVLISPWTRGGWVTSEVTDHTSILQFLEKWTDAIGKPAVCRNISKWRRRVCGDLTSAFDFTAPVYGLPTLPKPSVTPVIGNPAAGGYLPPATSNSMPKQERGTKRARALPYQPNVNLEELALSVDGSISAALSFSNNGPHVRKASHFAVYNNAALLPSFADYPKLAPTQHTIEPVRGSADKNIRTSVELGLLSTPGIYDLTVVGPNRFLRHFTGSALAGDTTSRVTAAYYPDGFHRRPKLALTLTNAGKQPVTFTVRTNHYAKTAPRTIKVPAGGHVTHTVDPLKTSSGWYDVTVTVNGDQGWSRRLVGHLENGGPSITGS